MEEQFARISLEGEEFILTGDVWTGGDPDFTALVNAAWRIESAREPPSGSYDPDQLGAAVERLCARLGAELVWLRPLEHVPGRIY